MFVYEGKELCSVRDIIRCAARRGEDVESDDFVQRVLQAEESQRKKAAWGLGHTPVTVPSGPVVAPRAAATADHGALQRLVRSVSAHNAALLGKGEQQRAAGKRRRTVSPAEAAPVPPVPAVFEGPVDTRRRGAARRRADSADSAGAGRDRRRDSARRRRRRDASPPVVRLSRRRRRRRRDSSERRSRSSASSR
ncbi:hypothetical protein DIPPA_07408 [Diplonema papillatum]|nr:hypothetical protein DIPPA_07408 [Diplonema papillatum]